MNHEDYNTILEDCTTGRNGYINATTLCKKFNRPWADFLDMPSAKEYILMLEKEGIEAIRYVPSGRTMQTFVHPYLGIEFAQWLDPEFSLYVHQVYHSYLMGDADLGVEMIEKDDDPHKTSKARKFLKRNEIYTLVQQVVRLSIDTKYWTVFDDLYIGLYRLRTKQMHELGNVHVRDQIINHLSEKDLNMVSFILMLVLESGDLTSLTNVANDLRLVWERSTGKKLEPTWV